MPRKPNTSAKSQAKEADSAELRSRALEMRRAGKHVREIATTLGRSIGWVSENVRAAIRDIPLEAANEYRTHIVQREEAVIAAHYDTRGDAKSAVVIQASDRLLVDVLGLAVKPEMKLLSDASDDALVAELERRLNVAPKAEEPTS